MSSSGVLAVVFEVIRHTSANLEDLMNLTDMFFFETAFCVKESFSVADVAVGSYLLYVRTLGCLRV